MRANCCLSYKATVSDSSAFVLYLSCTCCVLVVYLLCTCPLNTRLSHTSKIRLTTVFFAKCFDKKKLQTEIRLYSVS